MERHHVAVGRYQRGDLLDLLVRSEVHSVEALRRTAARRRDRRHDASTTARAVVHQEVGELVADLDRRTDPESVHLVDEGGCRIPQRAAVLGIAENEVRGEVIAGQDDAFLRAKLLVGDSGSRLVDDGVVVHRAGNRHRGSEGYGLGREIPADRREAPVLQGFHGSVGLPERGRDLLDAEVGDDPQHEHFALIGSEAVEGVAHPVVAATCEHRRLGRRDPMRRVALEAVAPGERLALGTTGTGAALINEPAPRDREGPGSKPTCIAVEVCDGAKHAQQRLVGEAVRIVGALGPEVAHERLRDEVEQAIERPSLPVPRCPEDEHEFLVAEEATRHEGCIDRTTTALKRIGAEPPLA